MMDKKKYIVFLFGSTINFKQHFNNSIDGIIFNVNKNNIHLIC